MQDGHRAALANKTIRSRSNKDIGDTLEVKWTIVAKRVIAEPTPRTQMEAPRQGIYDYEVVPLGTAVPVRTASETSGSAPTVSFRRIG
jgi:hypothetical protein